MEGFTGEEETFVRDQRLYSEPGKLSKGWGDVLPGLRQLRPLHPLRITVCPGLRSVGQTGGHGSGSGGRVRRHG